jgi:hypothetical protein
MQSAHCVIVATHNPKGSRSKETSTLEQYFDELLGEPSEAAAPVDVRITADDAVRSEENIPQRMSYLPEDCVRTMIDMGWDVTT